MQISVWMTDLHGYDLKSPQCRACIWKIQKLFLNGLKTNWDVQNDHALASVQSIQSLSCVRLFVTSWMAACQASLSISNSWSLLKLMSIKLVMPSKHLILCHPLLLLPSVFPSTRVISSESALHIQWPKYWSCSFNINPSSVYSGLISFRMDWLYLIAVQGTLQESSNTTV